MTEAPPDQTSDNGSRIIVFHHILMRTGTFGIYQTADRKKKEQKTKMPKIAAF